jgi:hypothetical protein
LWMYRLEYEGNAESLASSNRVATVGLLEQHTPTAVDYFERRQPPAASTSNVTAARPTHCRPARSRGPAILGLRHQRHSTYARSLPTTHEVLTELDIFGARPYDDALQRRFVAAGWAVGRADDDRPPGAAAGVELVSSLPR